MEKKFIWILSGAVAVAMVAVGGLSVQKTTHEAVVAEGSLDDEPDGAESGTSLPVEVDEDRSAKVDEIVETINQEIEDDESLITQEFERETQSLEEGGGLLRELGESYDETQD